MSMSQAKKLPYATLNRMIKKMRKFLKEDDTVKKMFKDYDVDIEEIDFIPIKFGNLDVSAKTDHGVIILNYKLLTDGDFFKDFSYGVFYHLRIPAGFHIHTIEEVRATGYQHKCDSQSTFGSPIS